MSEFKKKRILITGAGSNFGFGKGAAIGLAKKGHEVIAGAQIWPQVTEFRRELQSLGLKTLQVEKLDTLDPYDVENALKWDIDILANNAGIGEVGPTSEIPLDLIRRTFETNIFGGLNLTQKFVRKWVEKQQPGKVVFTTSVVGLISGPGFGPYEASKHALEAFAEAMQMELAPFDIQVQTLNPGPYFTGFNETLIETASHWLDDRKNYFKRDHVQKLFEQTFKDDSSRLNPQEVIDAMVEIIPEENGKFRNVVPKSLEDMIKSAQKSAWENRIDLPTKKAA